MTAGPCRKSLALVLFFSGSTAFMAVKSTAHLCFRIVLDRLVGVKVCTAGSASTNRNGREFHNSKGTLDH
jgi:hypothetical protein